MRYLVIAWRAPTWFSPVPCSGSCSICPVSPCVCLCCAAFCTQLNRVICLKYKSGLLCPVAAQSKGQKSLQRPVSLYMTCPPLPPLLLPVVSCPSVSLTLVLHCRTAPVLACGPSGRPTLSTLFKMDDHTPHPLLPLFLARLSCSQLHISFPHIKYHLLGYYIIDLLVMLVSFLSSASENANCREQGFFVYFLY